MVHETSFMFGIDLRYDFWANFLRMSKGVMIFAGAISSIHHDTEVRTPLLSRKVLTKFALLYPKLWQLLLSTQTSSELSLLVLPIMRLKNIGSW